MAEKSVVFITGANTGIGYETVRALLGQNERAQAASALKEEFPTTPSLIALIQIDVSSDDSINAAFKTIKSQTGYIDVLVNNAGHSLDNRIRAGEHTMREAWNEMYNANVTGAQVLTHTFVPLLLAAKSKDARLLFLTSGLAQLETMQRSYYPGPPPRAGWPKGSQASAPTATGPARRGLNMMMLTWHWVLEEDGVKVWSISPGFLATNLSGDSEALRRVGAGHPSIGGILIKKVIEGEG